MPFHSFLDFYSSLLLLVILSWWVFSSPSTMVLLHCQCCWLLLFGWFFYFIIAHEFDQSFGLMLTSELLCWVIIFSPYTPPPPSEAYFWNRPMQWQRRCRCRPILQLHRSSSTSSCRWWPTCENLSRIIILWCRADILRRWDQPRDLAYTSLWPSTVRLLSTPQLLVNRGISLIDSSRQAKVSGVKGNFKSAAVLTGR